MCDPEISCIRRPWPTGGLLRQKQNEFSLSETSCYSSENPRFAIWCVNFNILKDHCLKNWAGMAQSV